MTASDKEPTDVGVFRANLNHEPSHVNCSEPQRFFAGGWLIYVSSETNLLDVAVAFSQDDKDKVSKWLTSGEVAKVSDEQAKQWHAEDAIFWSTVVKPWVLIQPSKEPDTPTSDQTQLH